LFVKSPRFFENDLVEATSHSKWYFVPIMPLLLSIYFFYSIPSWASFELLSFLAAVGAGVLTFSLAEYITHRFFFHCERYLPHNRILRHLHFFTHGVHHMLPNDP
jgi:4-hydroxysphinganine ceramide fatty acyl 2-hydroxylase